MTLPVSDPQAAGKAPLARQLTRFVISEGISAVVDFGLLNLLMAVGLGVSMVLQAIIHMGVNVHLLPNTGITLPLISWGGTSIWFNAFALGIILSVSAYVDERKKDKSGKKKDAIIDEIHG